MGELCANDQILGSFNLAPPKPRTRIRERRCWKPRPVRFKLEGSNGAAKCSRDMGSPGSGLSADLRLPDHVAAFWGRSTRNGDLVSMPGPRLLTLTSTATTLADARTLAYDAIGAFKAQCPPATPPALLFNIGREP
jgi:hypothetical protein